jgi:hypothetical protein
VSRAEASRAEASRAEQVTTQHVTITANVLEHVGSQRNICDARDNLRLAVVEALELRLREPRKRVGGDSASECPQTQ